MFKFNTLQAPFPTARLMLVTVLWLTAIGLVLPSPAEADAEGEREALARLVHELEALRPMIKAAEAQAPSEARVRFQYDWLRADLRRVAQGIQDHIDAPRGEPRLVEPLRGDYRR